MAGSVRCSKAADPISLSRDRLYCSDLSFLKGNQLRLKPSKARILMTLTLPRKIIPEKRDEEFNRALSKPSTKEEAIAKPVRKVPKGKQVTHSMPEEKKEIFKSLESWAETNILTYLKPVEKCWQASDFLPESSSEGFYDQVKELRERSAGLPDEYLVCLVGNMITEEALPTYQSWINTLDGTRDESGADASSWAIWSRSWTAEENRHGDLLNKYLYLTGRVDNRKIEQTIQYLIGSGMDLQTENSPYLGFIYTSFQERATAISHGNTSRYAKQCGDATLAAICGVIAADEKRHENAYTKIVSKLFELDPDYTMLSLEDMMRKKITMPAFLMYDGERADVFESYSSVAQRAGVYTARDYANILSHLVSKWHVDQLTCLSPSAQRAQEYVCNLPARIMKLDERAQSKVKQGPHLGRFSWVFNREVALL